MVPPLRRGAYQITRTTIWDSNLYIGRNYREDLSLLPKKIVTVPIDEDRPSSTRAILFLPDFNSPDQDIPQWFVEPVGDGKYRLSIRGNPAVALEGSLFETLLPDFGPDEWIIAYCENDNAYTYTILSLMV
jgi:hypothetical protein